MIEDNNQIHKLINKNTQLVIYNNIWGHNLIQTLNNYENSSKFLLETASTSSQQSLLTLLKLESIASLPMQSVVSKMAKTALVNGQRYLFKTINSEYQRLNEVDMKSVIGVGINGNFTEERVDCYVEIRQFNRKGKYQISILKNIFESKKEFRAFCDETFSEIIFSLILSHIDSDMLDFKNQYPSFITIESIIQQICLGENESILLPSMFVSPPLKDVSIFSGSFNPFHNGHHQMYNLSVTHPFNQNIPVIFEITTKNAEKQQNTQVEDRIKSIISYFDPKILELPSQPFSEQLLSSLSTSMINSNIQILISNKGRFIQKQLTKGCFIIGGDTYIRLFDFKFYNNDAKELKKVIAKFVVDEIKFLVFNRKNNTTGQFEEIKDFGVEYQVFEGWSNDISSTKIRQIVKFF